jgi:hypothetical protein
MQQNIGILQKEKRKKRKRKKRKRKKRKRKKRKTRKKLTSLVTISSHLQSFVSNPFRH